MTLMTLNGSLMPPNDSSPSHVQSPARHSHWSISFPVLFFVWAGLSAPNTGPRRAESGVCWRLQALPLSLVIQQQLSAVSSPGRQPGRRRGRVYHAPGNTGDTSNGNRGTKLDLVPDILIQIQSLALNLCPRKQWVTEESTVTAWPTSCNVHNTLSIFSCSANTCRLIRNLLWQHCQQ